MISPTEARILDGLLKHSSKETFALDLIKELNGKPNRGAIYVTLDRLEDAGLIFSRIIEPLPGTHDLPRRLYRVTGLGVQALDLWKSAKEAADRFFSKEPAYGLR